MTFFPTFQSLLDFQLAKNLGAQPVFVLNQAPASDNNQIDIRQVWLDESKNIAEKMFSAINKLNELHETNSEDIADLFETSDLSKSLEALFSDVKIFAIELGRLCIHEKPKKIDEYFATNFKSLEQRYGTLEFQVDAYGKLLISWTDVLDSLYDHFSAGGYDYLSNVAASRDSIGISDYESVLPEAQFNDLKLEFDEIFVEQFGSLCDLYDENEHIYTDVRDLMFEYWEKIRTGVTLGDQANNRISTLISSGLEAVEESEQMRNLIATSLDKFQSKLGRQSKLASVSPKGTSLTEKLAELESLLESGKLTKSEYKTLRTKLISG